VFLSRPFSPRQISFYYRKRKTHFVDIVLYGLGDEFDGSDGVESIVGQGIQEPFDKYTRSITEAL
jgi:hypothetical protein